MVAVLHGAVVGGGLEIAAACHIRVAEGSAYYALPEGSRGIFVGGGGSVRLPRLIGTSRMMDMMLTGRSYDAEEGQAIGISHYLVAPGEGLAKGIELAKRIAGNAPMTNFAVTQVLPRIAESDPATGYVTEALISAIAQADGEAKSRLKAFLEKRAPKVVHRVQDPRKQTCATRPDAERRTMAAPVKERRPEAAPAAPVRPVRLGPRDVVVERRPDGTIHLKSPHALAPYPAKLTERLEYWAATAPERVFLAQRDATGGWRKLTYAETLEQVRRIGAALLQRELSPERPIAILSGNDIEHALIGLAAMYVGVPYAPISPAYSLISQDFGKLRSIIEPAHAGSRLRRRRRALPPRDRGGGAARRRGRRRPQPAARPSDHSTADVADAARDSGCRRGARPRSGPTPSSSSCSPRARPARRKR